MPKSVKKATRSNIKKGLSKKKKLPRGYKECSGCKKLLHIHKHVCDTCGYRHDMKKKKADILKSLNKMTPKLLRSIIELNDFNEAPQRYSCISSFPLSSSGEYFKVDSKKKRANKNNSQKQLMEWSFSSDDRVSFCKFNNPLTAICQVGELTVLSKSITKMGDYSQNDRKTVKTFNIEQLHRLGTVYTGKSDILFYKSQKYLFHILINEHIRSIKGVGNKIGLLNGKGSISIITIQQMPLNSFEEKFLDSTNLPELRVKNEDQIITFELLTFDQKEGSARVLAGTLMGHLIVFRSEGKTVEQERVIKSAHFQAITCLSVCPLNTMEQCMFATGAYDGSLRVWSLFERQPLFELELSNRNINSLVWDPGAKFIFISRDESQDSGVLSCFFSILKSEESFSLSDSVDLRLVRNTSNCKILNYSSSSRFCLLDCYQCTIRMLQIEDLRKNSLKRKKGKKDDEEDMFKLIFSSDKVTLVKTHYADESRADEAMSETHLPTPFIVDAFLTRAEGTDCIYGITNSGILFSVLIPQP